MSQQQSYACPGDDAEWLRAGPNSMFGPEAMPMTDMEAREGQPMLGIAIAVALSLPVWGVVAAVWLTW